MLTIADGDLGGRKKGRRKKAASCKVGRKHFWTPTKAGPRCMSVGKSGRGKPKFAASKCCRRGAKGWRGAKRRRIVRPYGIPFWMSVGRAGRRCAMRTPRGLRFRTSARCKRVRTAVSGVRGMHGLRGLRAYFRGMEGYTMPALDSRSVAILGDAGLGLAEALPTVVADADLDGRRRRRGARRRRRAMHCVRVARGRNGRCVCKKWAKGRRAGTFKRACGRAGLRMGFAGLRGLDDVALGEVAADREFRLDGVDLGGQEVPKKCTRWETVKSPAFGRPVKVCAAFDGLDDDMDAPLNGALAKWAGLGQVGGGIGPTAGVVIGGILAALAAKFGGAVPVLGGLPPVLLAAAAAGVAALALPRYRQAAVGALVGIGTVGAYKVISSGTFAGLGAIVPEMEGLGAIVPELEGLGAQVDVLSDYEDEDEDEDEDEMSGFGAQVDVLSGAFGSLPFAGAH